MVSSGPWTSKEWAAGEELLYDSCTHPIGLPAGSGANWTETQFSVVKMCSLIHVVDNAHSVRAAGEGLEAKLRFLSPQRHNTTLGGTDGGLCGR